METGKGETDIDRGFSPACHFLTPEKAYNEMKRNKQAGFSLIELLVVVAIILVIAAIAIPNFLSAKNTSQSSAAAGTLKNFTTAAAIYQTQYQAFPPTAASLGGTPTQCASANGGDATHACLLADSVASAMDAGTTDVGAYKFTYNLDTTTGWHVNGDPDTAKTGAKRHFYVDQSSTIRFSDVAPAAPGDFPL